MKLAWDRIRIIARREFLATVKRKAFIFTALGTPAYFAFVSFFAIGGSLGDRKDLMRSFTSLGVVDSTGLYANADRVIDTAMRLDANPFAKDVPMERFRTEVRFYPDQERAEAALRAGDVSQVLVVPADYLDRGELRRYARKSSIFSSADRRPIAAWLTQGLVAARVDSLTARRAARPTEDVSLFILGPAGDFVLNDDRRELVDFLLPFGFAMLLGLCITVGGQYLLYGVSVEKESRILESLLCNVSAQDLLAGKLIGLGAAGLSLVAFWMAISLPFVGAVAAVVSLSLPPTLLAAALGYFVFGYLFYASIMTGIGAVTSNMREAQQFSVWLSFLNFVPMIVITRVLSQPDGPVATVLSLFPPTAATGMMLRMSAPASSVPGWQILLSLGLLAAAALGVLVFSARVFRVGLLMYGKTPTLPEILRWARQG